MAFDINKFNKTEYQVKTKEVDASFVKDFFSEDENPVFKVRGLNLNEITDAQDAHDNLERQKYAVEALSGNMKLDKQVIGKFMEAIAGKGNTDNPFTARMKNTLEAGIVEPALTIKEINKLCDNFPIQMMSMFSVISELTGEGGEIAKKKPTPSSSETK